MIKVAINGFGRIGRLFLRQALLEPELDIVAINDLADPENLAYLFKYDSVYRQYSKEVSVGGGQLVVDGRTIKILQEKDPSKLPWKELNVDLVVEATGFFSSYSAASAHIKKGGAKRVVITAPAKDEEGVEGGKTILIGSNGEEIGSCQISSNGSCTTNATAPVVAIMGEAIGVKKAMLTTVHGYTATQSIVDGPAKGKDMRKGRAAAQNIIPSTTGAAIAVTRVFKNLESKFDGIAMRVPVISGSIVDFTFVANKPTSVEAVNNSFKNAANSARWKGILQTTEDSVVSSDIIGQSYAAIVDLSYTKVVDGDLVKVLSWYDNEWGYVTTLLAHVLKAGKTL